MQAATRPLAITAAAGAVAAASVAAAWLLAYPSVAMSAATVRAVADAAAVVALGLTLVPLLDDPRHRPEVVAAAATPLVVAGGSWLLAELARQLVAAADAAGVAASGLGLRLLVDYSVATAPGRAGLVAVLAAAAVCVLAGARTRSSTVSALAAGMAAAGIAARAVSGHLADHAWAAAAIAVHALAAALWVGTVAALLLTVRHRGRWARMLPTFSRVALWSLAVLLLTGVAATPVVIESPAALIVTGYGRLLTAKIVLAAVLVAVGWRGRTWWTPAARSHRAAAHTSRRRLSAELAIMAAAVAAAAALAVSG